MGWLRVLLIASRMAADSEARRGATRSGDAMSGGASALAMVSGHGFLVGRGLSLDGLVMRYRSSRAHCLHLMADLGALGDCESHLGLNSTSVTSSANVSLGVLMS